MSWRFLFGVVFVSMGNSMFTRSMIAQDGVLLDDFLSGMMVAAGAIMIYRALKP